MNLVGSSKAISASNVNKSKTFIIQTQLIMLQAKSPYQHDLKRVSQLVKKINYTPQLEINSALANYFSQQFLANIKTQISQKAKPSKSILQALKHSNTQLMQYKKKVQELKAQVFELNKQNKELLQTINKLNQAKLKEQIQQKCITKTKNLGISATKFIHIEEKSEDFEMEMLKEKLSHFDEYRKMKEARMLQMVQKESKLMGEIDILKYKNQTLTSRIACLQEALKGMSESKAQQKQQQQVQFARSDSKESQFVKTYVNYQMNRDQMKKTSMPRNSANSGPRHSGLSISCTRNVEIQEQYNIEVLACKISKQDVGKNQDFLQIDGLLQEYLPYTNTMSNIGSNKQMNNPTSQNNLMIQSQIQIQIDK